MANDRFTKGFGETFSTGLQLGAKAAESEMSRREQRATELAKHNRELEQDRKASTQIIDSSIGVLESLGRAEDIEQLMELKKQGASASTVKTAMNNMLSGAKLQKGDVEDNQMAARTYAQLRSEGVGEDEAQRLSGFNSARVIQDASRTEPPVQSGVDTQPPQLESLNIDDFDIDSIVTPKKQFETSDSIEEKNNIVDNLTKDLRLPSGSNSGFITTQIKNGVPTIKNLDAAILEDLQGKAASESFKTAAKFMQTDTNFRRVVALFSTLVSQAKGKAKEQDGLGLVEGIKGMVMADWLKRPGFSRTKSYNSQRQEVILALGPILTNQNRFVRAAAEMIKDTVPGQFDPSDQMAQQIAQSITNAYKLRKATKEGIVSVEDIMKMNTAEDMERDLLAKVSLNNGEQQVLELAIQQVLNTPIASVRDIPDIEKFQGGSQEKTPKQSKADMLASKANEIAEANPDLTREEIMSRARREVR